MKTTETKLAESIANAVEDHWFMPSSIGRILANQPLWTIDRIMELVVHIIKHADVRYDEGQGEVSEGLILANELNAAIRAIKEYTEFNNIKLPKSPSQVLKALPEVYQMSAEERSWIKSNATPLLVDIH